MKLEDFVAESLKEIFAGIQTAQAEANSQGGMINVAPQRRSAQFIREINFDVAVTTSEGTSKNGGIGLMVGPIGLGAKGASDASNSSVTRIKFSVPVVFPNRKILAPIRQPLDEMKHRK